MILSHPVYGALRNCCTMQRKVNIKCGIPNEANYGLKKVVVALAVNPVCKYDT